MAEGTVGGRGSSRARDGNRRVASVGAARRRIPRLRLDATKPVGWSPGLLAESHECTHPLSLDRDPVGEDCQGSVWVRLVAYLIEDLAHRADGARIRVRRLCHSGDGDPPSNAIDNLFTSRITHAGGMQTAPRPFSRSLRQDRVVTRTANASVPRPGRDGGMCERAARGRPLVVKSSPARAVSWPG